MKKVLFWLCSFLYAIYGMGAKSIYIPQEWRYFNSNDTLLYSETDTNNSYTWSKSRSVETDNFIIFWDKYYTVAPNQLSSSDYYYIDLDYLKEQAEAFYDMEINTLGFVDPVNSNVAKYKIMILLNHTQTWTCYGGGYDFQVPALWLNPATCKPVGSAVAHEIGHSFHYMCYAEASNQGTLSNVATGFHYPIGNGATIWETTAQWQSIQSVPSVMYTESINIFRNSHNYSFMNEWHRYQCYWWMFYLSDKYGITTVADVWNYPETVSKDFNEVLMDMKSMSTTEFYKEYMEFAMQSVTWDFSACVGYRDSYIGDFNYRCAINDDGKYQVAFASCPQNTGYNVIPLEVPQSGTTVTTHFTALPNGSALASADPSQYLDGNSQFVSSGMSNYVSNNYASYRGFRLGYVALLSDGTRKYYTDDKVYCTGTSKTTEDVSFTVPANTSKMWLVVCPALTSYIEHAWDENIANDDMWPYEFTIDGTDIGSKATVYAEPVIDGRDIADATITYDVYFPAASDYSGTSVTVGGNAAVVLGTAFQMQLSDIAGKMTSYSESGPSAGQIMFYAANSDGSLISSGSTANGYGHWFNSTGGVTSYGSSSYLYSEFDNSSITFNIGQYPSLLSNGSTYTIRNALRYKDSNSNEAKVVFVFNVHTDASKTGVSLSSVDYSGEDISGADDETEVAAAKAEFQTLYDYVKAIYDVSKYEELTEGAHTALGTALSSLSASVNASSKVSEIESYNSSLKSAAMTYIANANPTGTAKFDLSFLVDNSNLEGLFTEWGIQPEGWYTDQTGGNFQVMENDRVTSADGNYKSFMEYWSATPVTSGFSLYQKITLPAGYYQMSAQAFAQFDNLDGATVKNITFSANETDGTLVDGDVLSEESVIFSQSSESEVKIGLKAQEGNQARWMGIGYVGLYKTADLSSYYSEYESIYNYVKALYDVTGYEELVEGSHSVLGSVLDYAESSMKTAISSEEWEAINDTLLSAAKVYVENANPTGDNVFDITFLLDNADLTPYWDGTWYIRPEGWYTEQTGGNFQVMQNSNVTSQDGTYTTFMEYWSADAATDGFALYQKIGLPAGNYRMSAQTFASFDNVSGASVKNITFSANDVDGTVISSDRLSESSVNYYLADADTLKIGLKAHSGNQARWMGIGYAKLYKTAINEIVLDENTDFTAVSTSGEIVLNREFTGGEWTTLVLPFDMSTEEIYEAFGDETRMAELEDVSVSGDATMFMFVTIPSPAISANVPVIIRTENSGSQYNFGIKTLSEPSNGLTLNNGSNRFVGSYSASSIIDSDSYYFNGGKIYKSDSTAELKGFSAYFKMNDSNVKNLIVNIDGDNATVINGVNAESSVSDDAIYNLQGVRVEHPTERGVYIRGGKKIYVK